MIWMIVSMVVFVGGLANFLVGRGMKKANQELGKEKGASQGKCGECGYRVEGVSGLRCPECGSDLREVGIDVKESKKQGYIMRGKRMMWSGGVMFVCFGGLYVVCEMLKQMQSV